MNRRALLMWLAVLVPAVVHADKPGADVWCYPDSGRTSTSESLLGKAGKLTSHKLTTRDSVEDVVTWYAKRLGISADHDLLKAASAGFAKLNSDLDGTWTVAYDTENRKSTALILGTISRTHAHVTIYFRPNVESSHTVTISISQIPSGTSIMVLVPEQK